MDRNPVKHNPRCAFVVKQIISSNELKKKLKNTSPKTANSRYSLSPALTSRPHAATMVNADGYSLASPSQKDQMRSRLNMSGAALKGLTSKRPSASGHAVASSLPKRKLKANNILIDTHEDPQFEDYVVIGRKSEDVASVESAQQPLMPSASILSTSYDPEYDPNNLQKELDNLKKMRQNYGTEWLLSAPSFVSASMKKSSSFLNRNNAELTSPKLASLDSSSQLAAQVDDQYLHETIESFAVYKIQDIGQASIEKADKKLCILSLNAKLLVERDETNVTLLNVKELANLSDAVCLNCDNE